MIQLIVAPIEQEYLDQLARAFAEDVLSTATPRQRTIIAVYGGMVELGATPTPDAAHDFHRAFGSNLPDGYEASIDGMLRADVTWLEKRIAQYIYLERRAVIYGGAK